MMVTAKSLLPLTHTGGRRCEDNKCPTGSDPGLPCPWCLPAWEALACDGEPCDESPGDDISSLVTSAADASVSADERRTGNGFSKATL